MKNLFSLILSLLLTASLGAQTTLGPGDVMFTLINTDNTDAFAFVLLKDVTAGTSFRVTKGEYKAGVLQTGDGTTEITFTSASSCGAEFLFTSQVSGNGSSTGFYNPTPLNGGGSVTSNLVDGSSMTLASSGDGLIAFQGGTYISILQKCGFGFGNTDSQCSDLPPGLTVGVNALAYTNNLTGDLGEPDNIKYNCSTTNGTPVQLSGALTTNGNWLENDAAPISYGNGCGFTCQASCVDPVINNLTSSPANPCPGDQVTITINGSRGDAAQWRLHLTDCTTMVDPNAQGYQSTQGQTFTVIAGANITYYVSALDCNNDRVCDEVTITPSVEAADAGTDQLLLSGTSATLSANNGGNGNGLWSIVSGDGGSVATASSPTSTFTGTAGQAYTLRWTISGGGCVTTSDDVEISFTQGGTTLAAGDLAFIGFNSDAPDEFSFITLGEIEAGTLVFFTDMGWLQSGSFRSTSEGLIALTFDRNYGCGDAFYLTRTPLSGNNWEAFDEAGATAGTVSIPPVPGSIPDIGTAGDQVFAFQGSLGNPTLLAGIHVGEAWSEATSNSSSAQPAALTGNNTSVNLTQDIDNGIYDCSVTSGVPAVLRTAINNASNWNLSADLIPLTPACDFNCQDCAEPVITSLSASPDPVCAGQTTTITVTGDLMGATRWVVYAPGDCGGTELGTSTGANTITFTPAGTGDYLVAGIEGCVATPVCSTVTITQTGNPAQITMQQPTTKIFGTSVALTAAPLGAGQTGTWTIVSGTDNGGSLTDPSGPNAMLTGTEGNGYQLRYTVTGNGCPETTDEVFVSFLVDNGVSFGGMVFTGYNSQPTDNFSLVVLESLTAGTAFSVTDNGWLAAGGFRSGERTANYFLCRPLSCGDNIRFEDDGNGYAPDGTVVAEIQNGTSFPEIGSIGDQLFLYSGFTAPTAGDESDFVAAIQMNCENGTCSEANWDGDATDNSSSARPAAFATGGSVFGGTAPLNNARYDCANGTNNENDLFALISNDANWSFQDGAFTLDGCDFVCDPPPVAVCQDITVEIDANGNPTTNGQPFMASDLDGGSTDNGSIDPSGFSVDITPGCANVTNPVSATTITLTVTDNLGQTATCTSQVTVEDNAAPSITCLTEYEVELEANGEFFLNNNIVNNVLTLSFTDNCSATPFNFGSNRRTMNCTDVGTPFAYNIAQFDDNGQNAICTVSIIVTDPNLYCDDDPVAVCQDAVAQIDANGNLVLDPASLDGGSTDDNTAAADLDFSIDFGGLVLDCGDVGMPAQPVTLMVTDNVGQSSTCTAQVTVEDNVPPVITCQDVVFDLDANGQFNPGSFGQPIIDNVLTSFSDNCATAVYGVVNGTQFSFSCADGPTATETYFFFDRQGGNQASCQVTITFNDPTLACDDDPVAVCQDAVAQIDANGNLVLDPASLDGGSTDDNTAAADLDFSIDFGGLVLDCDDVDMPAQTVTLMVTDNVGQSSTCTSQVTVEDNIAPVITCQNVAVDLLADGTFNSGGFSNFFLSNVLTSFSDNCAPTAHPFIGALQLAFGCADIGINNESYFFRDRMLGATSREDRCNVLIQINDPLGACGSDPVVNCQDFATGPDPGGSYTLDANSLDNGSTDDRSVYSLVFGTERNTIGQQSDAGGNFNNTGHGQSFTAPQTGNIQKIKVRFFAAKSNATLYLYNSGTGSGVAGSVGTPAYTQTGIELFAGPTGGLTEILLDTPFPVVSGQQYSFAFDGNTHPYYSNTDAYPGGDFIFGYDLSSGCCTFGDLVFEIDFIGPTTQEFSGDGIYPVTVYAVDDQGNVSDACNATFTLDQSLPVEWISFGANAGAKTVDLQWETSAEPDNAGFHVERSATGNDWVAIGEVSARTGNDQRYDFEDGAPLQGTSYYRLRQTDFDGQVSYSPVETVAFYGEDRVVIFPNPATNEVNVQLPDGAKLLGLLDVTGRSTKVRFDGENGRLRTDVSSLPAGVYFLRVRLADGGLSARRLMVR